LKKRKKQNDKKITSFIPKKNVQRGANERQKRQNFFDRKKGNNKEKQTNDEKNKKQI